jgi:ABC-type transporter Mla subunit MlaD
MAFGSDVSLLFKILVDASPGKKGLSDFKGDVAKEIAGINSEGSKLSSLADSAKGAAGAVGAIGGVAIGAGAALFGLAKQTADLGSEIFDASQKTGLGAEALSSLKLAADQSSSSLAEVAKGVTVFSRTVAEAARGSDEAKDKLRRLGIDPQEAINDLQGALAKAFKTINDAPEGIKQTAAATDAFGRSGANLLPTIKSFDGDLAGLIRRAKELGVTFTDEDARAADEFGDTLDTLGAQARGLANEVGKNLIPYITKEMQTLSGNVKDNRAAWKEWGKDTANAAIGAYEALKAYVEYAKYATGAGIIYSTLSAAGGVASSNAPPPTPTVPSGYRLGSGGRLIKLKPGESPTDYLTGKGNPAYDVDASAEAEKEKEAAAKKAAQEAEKRRKAESDARLKDIATEREKAKREYQSIIDDEKRTAEERAQVRDALTKALIALAERETEERKKQLEYQALALSEQRALEEESAQIVAEGETEKSELREKAAEEERQRLDEENKRWVDHLRRQYDVYSEFYDDRIAVIREGMTSGLIASGEGFDAIEELETRRLKDELHALREARERNLIEEQEYIDALEALQYRYTRTILEETRKRIEAHQREFQPTAPEGIGATAPVEFPNIGQDIVSQIGIAPGDNPISRAFALIREEMLETASVSQFTGQAIVDSFYSLTDAVGGAIEAYLLYDKSIGQALKMALAQTLAHIAAEAAIRSIYELAMGFASLFVNPAAAGSHFTAAALFGSIAVGAGIGAKAIAGNSFQQQGRGVGAAGGSGYAPTGAGTNSPVNETDRTIRESRYGTGSQKIGEIHIPITLDGQHLETKIVGLWNSNGRLRATLQNDLNGASFAPT